MVEPKPDASETDAFKRPFVLSLVGLIISVMAIGLASIPSLAFDQPLINPFVAKERTAPEPEKVPVSSEPEETGGVVFKYKSFSVRLGGKSQAKEVPPANDQLPKISDEAVALNPTARLVIADPARWFTIAAIGTALVGIVVASLGQVREQHRTLTATSIGCCAAAITWPYLAAGISVGVAAAVFILVLALLASVLSGGV